MKQPSAQDEDEQQRRQRSGLVEERIASISGARGVADDHRRPRPEPRDRRSLDPQRHRQDLDREDDAHLRRRPRRDEHEPGSANVICEPSDRSLVRSATSERLRSTAWKPNGLPLPLRRCRIPPSLNCALSLPAPSVVGTGCWSRCSCGLGLRIGRRSESSKGTTTSGTTVLAPGRLGTLTTVAAWRNSQDNSAKLSLLADFASA